LLSLVLLVSSAIVTTIVLLTNLMVITIVTILVRRHHHHIGQNVLQASVRPIAPFFSIRSTVCQCDNGHISEITMLHLVVPLINSKS
jgi:hypothetical protein